MFIDYHSDKIKRGVFVYEFLLSRDNILKVIIKLEFSTLLGLWLL